MGRIMPEECSHGRIFDWGDFGPEDVCLDGPHGEHCERCSWCSCAKCICPTGCKIDMGL